jgi:hypothetical protein
MSRSTDRDSLNNQLLFSLPMFEGTGAATVRDVARPHHPVTQTGTPAWTQLSPSGLWVMDFDGTNDYLSCLAASCADLGFTSGEFSGILWANVITGANRTLMSKSAASIGWRMYITTSPALVVYTENGSQWASLGVFAGVTQWRLYGFSRSGASVRVYLDGIDITSTAGAHGNPGATPAVDLQVGGPLVGLMSGKLALPPHLGQGALALGAPEYLEPGAPPFPSLRTMR